MLIKFSNILNNSKIKKFNFLITYVILSVPLTIHRNPSMQTHHAYLFQFYFRAEVEELGHLVETYISKVHISRGKGNRLDFAIFYAKEVGIRGRNRCTATKKEKKKMGSRPQAFFRNPFPTNRLSISGPLWRVIIAVKRLLHTVRVSHRRIHVLDNVDSFVFTWFHRFESFFQKVHTTFRFCAVS